ncbi:MAG: AMP-dependent synthetase and ligase [Rhizobacter sp.]|nr:AMP-dependent synthetase and ligase [Rhizobacter sp.]
MTSTPTVSNARRQTLADLLRRTARRLPRKTAVVCGSTRWTYEEFDDVCERVCRSLRERGVGVGDKVAVLARNSHAFVAMRFAIARAGAVLVPINFMLKAEEVAYILRHSQARLLCTDSGLAEQALAAAAQDTSIEQCIWLPSEAASQPVAGMLSFETLLQPRGAALPEPELQGSMLAQILYTSGTESLPKGAMLSHDAVISQYVSCLVAGQYATHDVMLHAMPLFHCAQLDVFFGPSVYHGLTNVITAQPSPDSVLPKIAEHGVTALFAPPTVWISLLRSPLFDTTPLTTLAKCYYGASIMPVAVLQELQQRLPGARLWNFYGQTEIAPTATVLQPEDQIRKAGSAGQAALNVETCIVDDDGREVPAGTVGEIVHRSPQLLSGYYRDEVRTAEAFAGGWFHSGDLGVMDDEGYLTVVDRKKDMIKTGGENVASREVEEALYRHPAVSEVAVVGLRHAVWIEAVTAIVVVKAGHSVDEAALIAHCKESLAGFKTPKRVIFTDGLPRNPSGKILKRELRTLHEGKDDGLV